MRSRFMLLAVLLSASVVVGESRLALTTTIDSYFQGYWQQQQISPSATCTDAEFLRRVSLDLTGVIPSVSEVRHFVELTDADKRAKLVNRLLESPRHATHLANQWRSILLPNMSGFDRFEAISGTQTWLRERFLRNLRYDRLVGEFLTVTGSASAGPALYYQANEFKPEKLAAGTARSFFGIRLGCAECHDHPFDEWKQEDFWSYAAFFARVRPDDRAMMNRTVSLTESTSGEVSLPDHQEPIAPRFLDGSTPNESANRRLELSMWAASDDNPYIARAAVNRVWAMLFGRGLSEPVDDLGPHNPPDHPELLEQLAAGFVSSGYDLRHLFSAIAKSEVYALSSTSTADLPAVSAFARMQTKPLTPDQLYDSLSRALRHKRWQRLGNEPSSTETRDFERGRFVAAMSTYAGSPTEFQSGLQQTLSLMNGTEFASLFNNPSLGLLAALDAPFFTDEERLETAFLAIVSRWPAENERTQLLAQMKEASSTQAFLADLVWALANSSEFRMNH